MSLEILKNARQYIENGFHTIGLEEYMKYFEETPTQFREVDSECDFVNLLCDLEVFFQDVNCVEELIKCFLCALNWFPKNAKLHNQFGCILIKNGESEEGINHILLAYKLASERREPCLAIEKNILHIMWNQMPRWHFRMLNGKLRNEAYKMAIHKAIEKGFKNMVDIGSGCGLLSLYGGSHYLHPTVMGFESNPVLYKKGLKLMRKYCQGINYQSYNTYSHSLQNIDETCRTNVLVTEIFDVAVFGEGILKSLFHAFNVLMQKTNICIIPAAVTLYVTGMKNTSFDVKYRLLNKIPSLQIENVCLTKFIQKDPYDAENLGKRGYNILTETVELMNLKFAEKNFIELLLQEQWMSNFQMRGVEDGTIDSLVVWFDLHLDDEIVISTNPFHKQNEPCWEQAIFHCQHPIPIKNREVLSMNVTVTNEHLNFQFMTAPICPNNKCFYISEDGIKFLNDKEWIDCLVSLAEKIPNSKKLIILDFCIFPLMGLLLATKGHEVYHFFKEEKDLDFIKYILTKNNIDSSLIKFVHFNRFPQCVLALNNLDFVVFEPIHQDGSLSVSPLQNIVFQKYEVQYVFSEIIVHFEMIYSNYLDYCNRVKKENVEPFTDIAEEINEYSGSEHPFLPHDFPHEKMTNEQTWNPVRDPCKVETIRASQSGKVNGILIWYTVVGLDEIKYSTKQSSYFSKNVLIFPEKQIETGELFRMLCQYEQGGFLKIEVCPEMWFRTNLERVSNTSSLNDYIKNNCRE